MRKRLGRSEYVPVWLHYVGDYVSSCDNARVHAWEVWVFDLYKYGKMAERKNLRYSEYVNIILTVPVL